MSLAQKKALVPKKAGLPTRLPVIGSCADRTTGWREPTGWLPKSVFNACVWGNGWQVHVLSLYKRRQQLLSVVFSLFL